MNQVVERREPRVRVMKVAVNETAPAVSLGEVEIAAPATMVWQVLTRIADWPTWNSDVKAAKLEGQLVPGTRFRWRAGPGTITSTLQVVEPPQRIEWTGKTFGIKAIHSYSLEARNGTTIVRSAESWDGLVVRLLRRSMTRSLEKAIDSGLRSLKVEVERLATSDGT